MARTTSTPKSLPAIVNQDYFSDYFLEYRLDAGLSDLYDRWKEAERNGDQTARTRVRRLGSAFDKHRPDASLAAPGSKELEERLDFGDLPLDAVGSLRSLNDAILEALGWEPDRDQVVTLLSGEKTVTVPVAHRCDTPSGLLLLALDAVFTTDPTTLVATKDAPEGWLLEPLTVGDKVVASTVLEAVQLIFTADEPPSYLLVAAGGAVLLLDRDRWGEGVFLGAEVDEAVGRGDDRPKGELAAIAALFSADAINPSGEAQSVLSNLLDKAASESAGVSKELRHGVRRSVELLARAVVKDVRERQKGAWLDIDPDELTRQCLRYLYRIIVLLFAEARPELGILPVDDSDYQAGYSLARLRETALVELHEEQARQNRHVQQSLRLVFQLVNEGYNPPATLAVDTRGLSFPGLGSSLFSDEACPMLDKAQIPDETLQQVLVNLCYTQEKSGRDRQALSYATLGINQLGAVYEGLMAYKGFLAKEELYEIDNDGDPDNGTWVIPVDRADEFPDGVFHKETGLDGQERRVRYNKGDFVFRLSGRDRQRSASYYTPEVLTEFTVRHTLDVYWEEHPDLTAADILNLTVCEPALGSGAFLNEAINQLAARYLKAAQDESGETIDPDQYQLELQKAKAHFAINQAYGVDLNGTAVELAEVSLWLNCMYPGLEAPDFSARLRRGNSLIGARRATYTVEQVKQQPWKKTKKGPVTAPTDRPLAEVPFGDVSGIHHFLLPGEGWGAAADAVELKGKGGKKPIEGLAEEWSQAVREWRKSIHRVPSQQQIDRLRALSARVEAAWKTAAQHAAEYQAAHRRPVEVWGSPADVVAEGGETSGSDYLDPEGPSERLRLLMNAWCALWMWAPSNGIELPTISQWLDAVELLLGQPSRDESHTLFSAYQLDEDRLDSVELFGRASIGEVIERFPWLGGCRAIAGFASFFHWESEFAAVFADGGFALQVGNPPWVRLDWDEAACLAEHDPWWGIADLTKVDAKEQAQRRDVALATEETVVLFSRDRSENAGLRSLLSAQSLEPNLAELRTNLYMVFMTNTWRRAAMGGAVGLIHPESHFVDPKAGSLRSSTYSRLRRHWQFSNELFLFAEVHHEREFSVNIYGGPGEIVFRQAVALLAPSTLDRSLDHDGTGDPPGIQFPEGGWDARPHRSRVMTIDLDVLSEWVQLFDEEHTPAEESRLYRPLTEFDLGALDAMASFPRRLSDVAYHWTTGFNEKNQKDDGTIRWDTRVPSDLSECVVQGPHIVVATPFGQEAKANYRNNTDWMPVDIEALDPDFIPRTNYQRASSRNVFEELQGDWDGAVPSTRFREAHREFVGSWGMRTMQACLLPPGPTHVHAVNSVALLDNASTVRWTGLLLTLPIDYLTKVSGTGHITRGLLASLPVPEDDHPISGALQLRTLRLNSLVRGFAPLWAEQFNPDWRSDKFASGVGTVDLGAVDEDWSDATPLRTDLDRWLALVDLDAIAALQLGVTIEQLCQMYRSQFPVLRKYESQMVFDRNGRQICGDYHAYGFKQAEWEAALKEAPSKRGQEKIKMWDRVQAYMAGDHSIDLGPFEPPFILADREAAMRRAYQAFSERLEATT